jgi:hypothetical protein
VLRTFASLVSNEPVLLIHALADIKKVMLADHIMPCSWPGGTGLDQADLKNCEWLSIPLVLSLTPQQATFIDTKTKTIPATDFRSFRCLRKMHVLTEQELQACPSRC